ncbi:spermatogenesis-associated protein 6 [Protopterus annectens]|uniref:spermatogenesis-associated protein 6 n=1 Tax=Protopterus annectens TaxID=7888 RepID=UPI001CF95B92|nr:spermatogenesis-associated protein 6 [Protopterus annectens]
MPKKSLKLTVSLTIHSITCPGVVLNDKDDVYFSIFMLGQYKKTKCLPALFPLFFHEKMKFEKIFDVAVDPGDVAELLESDATAFELIQLVPPVGETLATYEENTRDFLYPGPRLTPTYPGSDRELLLKRSTSFPGIAPKLEFSTVSVITECPSYETEKNIEVNMDLASFTPFQKLSVRSPRKESSPHERAKCYQSAKGYEQPTIASQSRSPSPYTKRRMCELSEDARQRLAHLNLGPFEFKKESNNKPPFVVRHTDNLLTSPLPTFSYLPSSKSSVRKAWFPDSDIYNDPSLLGSYRPKLIKDVSETQEKDSLFDFDEHIISRPAGKHTHSSWPLMVHSAPSSIQKYSQSPMLNRSSLKDRFQTDQDTTTNWEEIHDRIKNILKKHSSRRRLSFETDNSEKEHGACNRKASCEDSLCDSELQDSSVLRKNVSVHLDDGEYWSNRANMYKGKSHRTVFEESLEKIYRNMYKTASNPTMTKRASVLQ